MAGSGDEKSQAQLKEDQGTGSAASAEKILARLTTDEASGVRVVERVVHSGGGGGGPPMMLTRTNYTDWAMITKLTSCGAWWRRGKDRSATTGGR